MIRLYYYNRCGTSRKAKKFFDDHEIKYQLVEIVDEPPTKEELREMVIKSGIELKKFFNTSGQSYRDIGMKDKIKNLREEELLEILATDGKIIKRPLITDGTTVTVGWNEQVEAIWDKKKI